MTDKQVLYILLLILAIIAVASWLLFFPGCKILPVGGTDTTSEFLPKINEKLDQVVKNTDKVGDVQGDYTKILQTITEVKNDISNVQNNIKSVQNSGVMVVMIIVVIELSNLIMWIVDLKRRKV